MMDLVDNYYCDRCKDGVMRPEVCFYGEKLSRIFHSRLAKDALNADLLLVIGTSLSVRPVSDIISLVPAATLKILVNKTPLELKKQILFDKCFWTDCDELSGKILALV